jgi:hypothetical protein
MEADLVLVAAAAAASQRRATSARPRDRQEGPDLAAAGLERDGIVRRTVYDEVPAKVVYSIRDAGRDDLAAVVDVMCGWGFGRVERHGGTILNGTRATESRRTQHAS